MAFAYLSSEMFQKSGGDNIDPGKKWCYTFDLNDRLLCLFTHHALFCILTFTLHLASVVVSMFSMPVVYEKYQVRKTPLSP